MTINTPGTGRRGNGLGQQVIGAVIFVVVTAAWVFCKLNKLETGELLAFAVPVVGALFLVGSVDRAGDKAEKAADAASQAAQQTNGVLDARIQSAVSKALATRDAARTRQAQGDISEAVGAPTAPTASEPTDGQQPSESYQFS